MKIEDFWKNVDTKGPDDCWPWVGGKFPDGYGCCRIKGYSRYASRVAYELSHGVPPGKMFVCHSCDNPPCCNPAHLFLGTVADNSADMVSKGRSFKNKGTLNGGHKLTEDDVNKIRRMLQDGKSQHYIAETFGVSQGAIFNIASGKKWGWLTT